MRSRSSKPITSDSVPLEDPTGGEDEAKVPGSKSRRNPLLEELEGFGGVTEAGNERETLEATRALNRPGNGLYGGTVRGLVIVKEDEEEVGAREGDAAGAETERTAMAPSAREDYGGRR